MQKRHVLESGGASLAKRPHLESRIETLIWVARSLLMVVPASSVDGRKKGAMVVGASDMSQSTFSSSSLSLVFQVGMLSHFLDQWRCITSNRFVLTMVQGHHFQLRSHPLLFYNFLQFNVKAVAAHHPIIQEEVDELLAKGWIKASSGGAGFYSNMFAVPKHTSGL